MKSTQLIINRQKAAANRKYKGVLPEEPTISIHTGSEIDYAYAVKLTGDWILKQDYANSPCSGAHIWLQSTESSGLEITHRTPLSEHVSEDADGQSNEGQQSETTEDVNATPTPKTNVLDLF